VRAGFHKRAETLALLCIIALGGGARFFNLGWGEGVYDFHPDEWAINETARNLGPDLNPHFFFYGSLPIYLYRGLAELLSLFTGLDWLETARFLMVGRTISALASTVTILLLYLVGRKVWGGGVGLLAAGLGAGAVLLTQSAHFGTVESLLALEVTALLLVSLHIAGGAGRSAYALAGLIWGLSVATKLTALSFVVLPLAAYLFAHRRIGDGSNRVMGPLLFAGAATLTVFAASPYYFLAWGELWDAIVVQSRELDGEGFSYVWQFEGSVPYLFELYNLTVWGLGLPLGVAALAGWVVLLWEGSRRALRREEDGATLPTAFLATLVLWPTLYLLYIGTWEARFVRHLVPLVPFCALFGTYLIVKIGEWAGRRVAGLACGVVAVGTLLWAVSFLSVYASEDTRLAATRWLASNVAPGSRLVVESPNSPLIPLPSRLSPDTYRFDVLEVTASDTPDKMASFAGALARGDYVIVSNERWWGVLPRLGRFPLTGRYYELLRSGELGYTEAVRLSNTPRLGSLTWDSTRAEETFSVFDHPTVRIFRNSGRLSEERLWELLAAPP
jgi:hypothetical protein